MPKRTVPDVIKNNPAIQRQTKWSERISIGKWSKKKLQTENPGGRLLYHYTDLKGLIGIIQGGEIWATDALYLNDKSEQQDAYMNSRLAIGEYALKYGDDLDQFWSDLHGLLDFQEDTRFSESVYVVSYSELSDSLGQWRSYGGAGRGYAIGFNFEDRGEKLGLYTHALHKVTYSAEAHKAKVKEALRYAVPKLRSRLRHCKSDLERRMALRYVVDRIGKYIHAICAYAKSDHWKEEQEWRSIILYSLILHSGEHPISGAEYPQAKHEFRETKFGPTPFIRVKFNPTFEYAGKPRSRIQHIVLGPACDENLEIPAIKKMLYAAKFEEAGIRVEKSRVPLRT